ncbi:DNA-binding HEXBP [Lecanosticta acicola]|uniref:DNA-binding HEXBP n=1 Tax=Lecanosticta acicola TaxID=111012 RepID=A0AAI9E9P6_9PEZI|nr:DNA-binding HEXBP [Lecanosticta acicola]
MGASTWDDTPTPAGDNSWKADAGGDAGGWEPDNSMANNGFAEENISKHAGGVDFGDDAPRDGGCRVCGADSHFARDCPDKPANSGECYNCGETGHNKADCPNPRVEREFTGTCNFCGQEGHRKADCPENPTVCKLCKGTGHVAADCEVNRAEAMFASMGIKDMEGEEAWLAIVAGDKDKDVEDIKKAIFAYAKAVPYLLLPDLEGVFRAHNMNTRLIAKEQELSAAHTIINFQGKPDMKYVVSIQWSDKPKRAKFAEGWPSSTEENLLRLAEAGFIVDSLVPKCSNCNEYGHISKDCEQDKNEAAKVIISCANCSEEGHRARDCANPRKSGKKGCRNCHSSKGCEKERVIVCRNCDQEGHVSKECPEPRNMAKVQCRNCDEFGHTGRDCPKPTDWSRVECTTCHEKGHSYKRCSIKPEEGSGGNGGWGEGNGAGASSGGGGGGWENNDTGASSGVGGGGWENGNSSGPADTGGW